MPLSLPLLARLAIIATLIYAIARVFYVST
jgi:hypothetical protein